MTFIKTNNKNTGFTLPELLVVIFVSVIAIIGLVSLYLAQNRLTKGEINLGYSQTRIGATLNDIERIGGQAREILGSAVVDTITYTTDADTLVLSVPAIDANDDAIDNIYDTLVFEVDAGNALVLITQPGTGSVRVDRTAVLLGDVQGLVFNYENNTTPAQSAWFESTVSQSAESSSGSKIQSSTYRVYLKNKMP